MRTGLEGVSSQSRQTIVRSPSSETFIALENFGFTVTDIERADGVPAADPADRQAVNDGGHIVQQGPPAVGAQAGPAPVHGPPPQNWQAAERRDRLALATFGQVFGFVVTAGAVTMMAIGGMLAAGSDTHTTIFFIAGGAAFGLPGGALVAISVSLCIMALRPLWPQDTPPDPARRGSVPDGA